MQPYIRARASISGEHTLQLRLFVGVSLRPGQSIALSQSDTGEADVQGIELNSIPSADDAGSLDAAPSTAIADVFVRLKRQNSAVIDSPSAWDIRINGRKAVPNSVRRATWWPGDTLIGSCIYDLLSVHDVTLRFDRALTESDEVAARIRSTSKSLIDLVLEQKPGPKRQESEVPDRIAITAGSQWSAPFCESAADAKAVERLTLQQAAMLLPPSLKRRSKVASIVNATFKNQGCLANADRQCATIIDSAETFAPYGWGGGNAAPYNASHFLVESTAKRDANLANLSRNTTAYAYDEALGGITAFSWAFADALKALDIKPIDNGAPPNPFDERLSRFFALQRANSGGTQDGSERFDFATRGAFARLQSGSSSTSQIKAFPPGIWISDGAPPELIKDLLDVKSNGRIMTIAKGHHCARPDLRRKPIVTPAKRSRTSAK